MGLNPLLTSNPNKDRVCSFMIKKSCEQIKMETDQSIKQIALADLETVVEIKKLPSMKFVFLRLIDFR